MRAIKFRGMTPDGEMVFGEMVYSYSQSILFITHGDGWTPSYNSPDKGEENIYHAVIPETVGQFTGKKNHIGEDVYEGDIFRVEEPTDGIDEVYYIVVVWIHEWSMFATLLTDEYELYLDKGAEELDESLFWTFTLEQIDDAKCFPCGNIHQNPELLTS